MENWNSENRTIAKLTAAALVFLIAGWILYALFGHWLIEAIYDDRLTLLFNGFIKHGADRPLAFYFTKADSVIYNQVFICLAYFAVYLFWVYRGRYEGTVLDNDNVKIRRIHTEILISILFSTLFFVYWPTNIIFDDGGIILKYMDNFANGHFYCYNPKDGPVFGISGFIHGIVAGSFAYSRIFSPLNSLFASNYIGLALTFFISFRLLSVFLNKNTLIFPAWALLIFSNKFLLACAKQGLEAPLHLAIVLACVLFFLRNSRRPMLIFSSLAIISKLDAIPVVGLLLFLYIVKNRRSLGAAAAGMRFAGDLLLFTIAPVTVWVLFALAVFGGPIPQTLIAKYYFHPHPADHWFPFIQEFIENRTRAMAITASIMIFIAYLIHLLRSKAHEKIYSRPVFGFILAAVVLPYYFYNPNEKMPWYYILPVFSFIMQFLALITDLAVSFPRGYLPINICCVLVGLGIVPHQLRELRGVVRTCNLVERERIAVGEWVKNNSKPSDILFSGHGHIAERSGLYTVDYSGLNSKIVTALNYKNLIELLDFIKPDLAVTHGLLSQQGKSRGCYALKKSFYDITLTGWQPWRVYRKVDNTDELCGELLITPEMAKTNGKTIFDAGKGYKSIDVITGSEIEIKAPGGAIKAKYFICGLKREQKDLSVRVRVYDRKGGLLKKESVILKRIAARHGNWHTEEMKIKLDAAKETSLIKIEANELLSGAPNELQLIDPVLTGLFN